MADFLEQKRTELTKRLAELKPLVEEYGRLEQAVAALDGIPAASAAGANGGATAPRRRGRPPGSKRRAPAKGASPAKSATTPRAKATKPAGRPGRRRGSGKRGKQALTLIAAQPGITIPELAARMGIKQNYLYRVLPTLEGAGSIVKQGRGWHPK